MLVKDYQQKYHLQMGALLV